LKTSCTRTPSRPFTPAADDADTDDTAFADYDPNDVTCRDECDSGYTPDAERSVEDVHLPADPNDVGDPTDMPDSDPTEDDEPGAAA
jgi:hypothetical protein